MKKFKVIFFLLICITWAFDCHGRLETAKHNESRSSSIFEQKCSNCHEADKSRMLLKDEKAWEETLFRMSKKQGAHITRSDVEKLVSMHVERLKKAQKLFEKKCLNCHKRKNIRSPVEIEKTPDEWRETIKRMMGKAKEVMSDESIDTLIHYHIRAHSMITLGKSEAQSKILGLGSSELFERKCSICHSLEKSLHALKDEESWQKTIQAMTKKHGSTITESDISGLVNFHVARQKKEQELFLKDCSQCHPANIALETGKTDEQWKETARKMMNKAGRKISEEELDILTQYHIKYEKTMAGLAMKKCSQCHNKERILTTMGTADSWERIIVGMSEKEGSDITPDTVRTLVRYHVARQEIEQQVFTKDCSECHEPEETLKKKKSRDEWIQTIRRMMAKTDKMITDEDIDILINYHIARTR